MTDVIRTSRNGCFKVRSNAWGQFLAPCPDPQATAELEKGALERFELHPDIARLPADLWSRWVELCFHFAHLRQGDLEVSCRLLRQEDDRSAWRILVPRQEVTGASVRIDSFDEAIDIATGELIEQYPPAGWVPAGSSHSHNTMRLNRFSSTDDASELGCPGLHVVISHVDVARRTYVATASVTANNRRFYLSDAAAVIDLTPTSDSFHPAVLEVVQPERPRAASMWLPGHINRERDRWRTQEPMWHKNLDETPSQPGFCPNCSNRGKLVDLTSRLGHTHVSYKCSYCTNSWHERHDMPPDDEELAVPSDTIEEERQILLQEQYELARTMRDLVDAYGLDPQELLNEAREALEFTFSPDDPIYWSTDESDQPEHSSDCDSASTAAGIPTGCGQDQLPWQLPETASQSPHAGRSRQALP